MRDDPCNPNLNSSTGSNFKVRADPYAKTGTANAQHPAIALADATDVQPVSAHSVGMLGHTQVIAAFGHRRHKRAHSQHTQCRAVTLHCHRAGKSATLVSTGGNTSSNDTTWLRTRRCPYRHVCKPLPACTGWQGPEWHQAAAKHILPSINI